MRDNPLVEEVRAARHRISARFGHDVRKLAEHYQKREAELRRTGKVHFVEDASAVLKETPPPYKV